MAVILKDTVPPITEVAKLGYASVAVYSLLYQSAYQDQRYDKRSCAEDVIVVELQIGLIKPSLIHLGWVKVKCSNALTFC